MQRWIGPLSALAVFAMVVVSAMWWRHGNNPVPTAPSDGGNGLASEPTTPCVLLTEYRPGNDFDPGTVRVFLANPGPAPVTVNHVLLDGFPLPVWGLTGADADAEDIPLGETHGVAMDSAGRIQSEMPTLSAAPIPEPSPRTAGEPAPDAATADAAPSTSTGHGIKYWAYWAKIADATIPSGGVAEFSAKPMNPLFRPVRLEFGMNTGQSLSMPVSLDTPALRVESVAFADDRRAMYVYVRNAGPAPLAWRGVSLVERPSVHPDWQSGAELAPGQYGFATLPLADVEPGDFLTVRVDYGEGQRALERVRVLTGFPLARESGPGDPALGFDSAVYTAHFMNPEAAVAKAAPFQATQTALIFECAMHTYASRQDLSAREILRRYALLREFSPATPASIHLCRVRPETGYSLFAGTADILRFNPNVSDGLSKGEPGEPPEAVVARLCRYGHEAARPRPFHTLADTGAFHRRGAPASPEEFRRRTYAALGAGTRGILYRLAGNPPPALRAEIVRVNHEIARLRPHLAIACPVNWAAWSLAEDLPPGQVFSLLAGRDAVVVVVVVRFGQDAKEAEVSLRVPEWFQAGTMARISDGGEIEWPFQADQERGDLHFNVPPNVQAAAFLLGRAGP